MGRSSSAAHGPRRTAAPDPRGGHCCVPRRLSSDVGLHLENGRRAAQGAGQAQERADQGAPAAHGRRAQQPRCRRRGRGRPSSPPRRKGRAAARGCSARTRSRGCSRRRAAAASSTACSRSSSTCRRASARTRGCAWRRASTAPSSDSASSTRSSATSAAATADAPGSPMKAPAPAAGGAKAAPPPRLGGADGSGSAGVCAAVGGERLNASLEESVGAIIAHCEEVGRLKLVRLTADFVQDGESGEPTFIGCQEAVVLRPPPPQAKKKKALNRMGSMAAASPLVAAALEAGQDPTDAEQLLVKQKSLQVLAAFGSPAKDARRQSQPPPPPPPKDDDADGAPAERAHWAVAGARPPPWARLHPPLLRGAPPPPPPPASRAAGRGRCVARARRRGRARRVPVTIARWRTRPTSPTASRTLGADLAASVGGLQGGSGEEAASFSVNYRSLFLARLERDAPTKLAREGHAKLAQLIEQRKPGRAHPSMPRRIDPAHYYARAPECAPRAMSSTRASMRCAHRPLPPTCRRRRRRRRAARPPPARCEASRRASRPSRTCRRQRLGRGRRQWAPATPTRRQRSTRRPSRATPARATTSHRDASRSCWPISTRSRARRPTRRRRRRARHLTGGGAAADLVAGRRSSLHLAVRRSRRRQGRHDQPAVALRLRAARHVGGGDPSRLAVCAGRAFPLHATRIVGVEAFLRRPDGEAGASRVRAADGPSLQGTAQPRRFDVTAQPRQPRRHR